MSFTKQHLIVILVALVVIGTIGWFVMDDQGGKPAKRWFYDLNTGELFEGKPTDQPPIAAPSGDFKGGPGGVLARLGAGPEHKAVLLMTYTPEVKKLFEEADIQQKGLSGVNYSMISKGTVIAKPPEKPGDTPVWIQMDSPEGMKLSMETMSIPGIVAPGQVPPGSPGPAQPPR